MQKILVVDDELDSQAVLAIYLESRGYQVECASSGVQALSIFEGNPPDLVISDVMMPEMDGFEFCRRLRSSRLGQLVPFIFLSGQGELESKVEGHSIGGDDYLVKPFQPQELLAKVKGQLERSHRIHAEIVRLLQHSTFEQEKIPAPTVTRKSKPLPLTPAEERVFWEVIQGYTNKQVSDRLFISPRTVQAHLSSIFSKLELENRSQLVRFALEGGFNTPGSKDGGIVKDNL
ncbi:response regulator [Kamptonema sp. UHCC 0994]|uniref:response regulator transcription factor n=1 Tax=Kamptonema sp. UHCC 0994 TaxID=3031329 RepID=UPI0023B99079|nr:response regulator [Kamptonema sp. UHCC 0994]MDF0554837.1 response regulator [Kamptonema sp. UHCC 0994]